jgi:V/A-type H+/Na+-transporting ATPase subunit D
VRNVAPTKTSLLRLGSELKFARLGYELLDQKRNILVLELLNLVDQTVEFQERMGKAMAEAFRTLEQAVLRMGRLRATQLAGAVNIRAEIHIRQRRIMGVPLPVVETEYEEKPPFYSPLDTSFWIDASVASFKEALSIMGRFAELKISVTRLAQEVRKTIRKVNALEKIAIPDLVETVTFVRNRLEENERDMFVLMKLVKRRLEVAETAGRPR